MKDNDGFIIKKYRCEWCCNVVEVDQYEKQQRVIEYNPFPTRDEAEIYRAIIATEHEFVKGRWIPNNAKSSYVQVEIQYREIEIK